MEDVWFIVVTEGHEDEPEIDAFESRRRADGSGYAAQDAQAVLGRREEPGRAVWRRLYCRTMPPGRARREALLQRACLAVVMDLHSKAIVRLVDAS